ncbi:uncharacterized protein si:ch211-14k19.8 [Cyprinodon tularosa]|uniref:uncharacterized protein si:ch211-14k19.8 n=1 Tax=Cyprinodon tularosa TaxID=77115 RepID=UPI0018E210B1|nr:uncharacterized protein si:ch211-14k19.8 [Cyprinodon tularosa]
MQLHVYLLLFLFTTDKTLASLNQHCGGNVTLDHEPVGHINLSLPDFFNNTNGLSSINKQPGENLPLSNCTLMLVIPLGRKVLLKLEWMDRHSSISVRCGGQDQIFQIHQETMLLSDCDKNKAFLSWTGPGIFSNSIQLVYYVQENEKNSTAGGSAYKQDGNPTGWNEKGATFAQEMVRGTEEGRIRVSQSFGPHSESTSPQDEKLVQPTSSQWGHPVSGRTDRETLPLPEEEQNNGADTSGAAHLTDDPMTAITRPYFQPTVSADTKSQTENRTGVTQGQTETSWTAEKVSLSITTDLQSSTSTKTEGPITERDESTAQTNQSVSIFSMSNSSFSGVLTWSNTSVDPHGGAVDQSFEDKQARSHRFYSTPTIPISEHLKPSLKPPNSTHPTLPSHSSPPDSGSAPSPTTYVAEISTSLGTAENASPQQHTAQRDSSLPEVYTKRPALKPSNRLKNTDAFYTAAPSTQSQKNSTQNTEASLHSLHSSSTLTQTSGIETQTATEGMRRSGTAFYLTTNIIQRLFSKEGSLSTVRPDAIKAQTSTSPSANREMPFIPVTESPNDSPSVSSTPPYVLPTQTRLPDDTHITLTSSINESFTDMSSMDPKTTPKSSQNSLLLLKSSPTVSPNKHLITTPKIPLFPVKSESGDVKGTTFWQWSQSSTISHSPPDGQAPAFHPSQHNNFSGTSSALNPTASGSSTQSPVYYIVPNQPATIRVESVELLLQIVLEDIHPASAAGLKEDVMAWLEIHMHRAPGFSKLLGVWSSGLAVQSLVVFKTSEALQWLSISEPNSLLEQTGLAQALHHGKMFRSSRITNITVGGLQGDVCDWLLQCPSGYKCVTQTSTTNYSCSSACHFDYCHHHGICTHHPGQLPVCRCLVGEDFWYMGKRCDIRMTRARLIGVCLAILLIIVMAIGLLACLAVRHYRTILIQAKVDQTRSSYRKFNHFDELSGRFWLRSWAGSADSLDNPAFMRSDELLHLRALDRPCCYHDDTLSLPSTCPSHGTRINTIYPHSSQYGWRGSGMSMGDGVLDSGKASDLSVCSWPVEPIHWTPFPLLQQLASHRTPTVRVTRPRSYCEGMELVDMGKSWTA